MRIYAYEEITYGRLPNRKTIGKGEVVEIDAGQAKKLAASHPESLLLLADGEEPPKARNEFETTVVVRPEYTRQMIPGRLSPQKRRQLKAAQKRSPGRAHMTLRN